MVVKIAIGAIEMLQLDVGKHEPIVATTVPRKPLLEAIMRRPMVASLFCVFVGLTLAGFCQSADGQSQANLSAELQQKIDQVATDALAKTKEPSASIAIVKDGKIVYSHAYGSARLDPSTPAKPEMRYSVGSISKQFTATAMLLLQEEGKLSIDDNVGKFLPGVTQGTKVTIRQFSHTSGYQDFYAQDYMLPMILQPTTPLKTVDLWARKPLDFESGTKWQYSNTNYTIAGLIVEKASGMPLLQFLQEKVFTPLGMKSVMDIDRTKLPGSDAAGYMRYALGPLRLAPIPARGWAFAAGELAMTAEDLAKWDVSIIDQRIMKPSSYRMFETEMLLKNGLGAGYGLGLFIGSQFGHRALSHAGGFSGYTAQNMVFPDEHAAIVVLTNQDSGDSADAIANGIAPLLLSLDDPTASERLAQARSIFEDLQHGTINRSRLTDNANFYFNDQALKDFAITLGPLGEPEEFVEMRQELRGGMKLRVYSIKFLNMGLLAWTYEMPNGKIEEYLVFAQN